MRLTRREALQGIGLAGIGAVVSACGGGNGASSEPTATAEPSAVRTASPTAPATSTSTPTAQPIPTHSPTEAATPSPTASSAPSTSSTQTPEATQPPPTQTSEATATASATDAAPDTPNPSPSPTATTTPTTSPVVPSCILSPEQTEGPYFLDLNLLRSDIREDRDGARLRLTLQVVDANGCTPIRDALVNLWHASAEGVYSGFAGQPGGVSTVGQTFLRGFQVTDADGRVEFITVYPGWYTGRTVHMHLKVHLDASSLLTSQLYFPDDFTDLVHEQAPYNQRAARDTTNQTDGIIRSGGVTSIEDVTLDVVEEDDGYAATMAIGVDLG